MARRVPSADDGFNPIGGRHRRKVSSTSATTTTTTAKRAEKEKQNEQYQMSQKRVLITGSTKGLGYELANQFLQEGDRVCVTSRSEANVRDVVL